MKTGGSDGSSWSKGNLTNKPVTSHRNGLFTWRKWEVKRWHRTDAQKVKEDQDGDGKTVKTDMESVGEGGM